MDTSSTQKSKRPKLECLDMTSIEDALPTDMQQDIRELNSSIKKLTSILEKYVAIMIDRPETHPSSIS
jgi:hypothetical protein